MRDVKEVAKRMARNGLKIAKSLGCAFHFESEFIFFKLLQIINKYLINVFTIQIIQQEAKFQ